MFVILCDIFYLSSQLCIIFALSPFNIRILLLYIVATTILCFSNLTFLFCILTPIFVLFYFTLYCSLEVLPSVPT